MKYRHHTGVRLSLVTGHATFVGPDWRGLHERYHHEALAKGCECDQSTIRTRTLEPAIAGENAVTPLNEAALMREGFERMIERNAEDDFTFDGNPNLDVLATECGFTIDRQLALSVWHDLVAEFRALTDSNGSEGDAGDDADAQDETVGPEATIADAPVIEAVAEVGEEAATEAVAAEAGTPDVTKEAGKVATGRRGRRAIE